MSAVLDEVAVLSRQGCPAAVPAVVSAHPDVLEASLRLARSRGRPIVIEATASQLAPECGYAGQTPGEFASQVDALAGRVGLDRSRIVLAGGQLGTWPWRSLPAETAMSRAEGLVRAFAKAGFTRLHLDGSRGCAGEPDLLPEEQAAERAAVLARAAVAARPARHLTFVIGAEVPHPSVLSPPGPIGPQAAHDALEAHLDAFQGLGRIGGFVAQPGVGFRAMEVHHLPLDRDPGLRPLVASREGLLLEAPATDYQRPEALTRLAELGFGLHKVGPALSFAWREAVYSLDRLAQIAGWIDRDLSETMELVMLADPRHWQGHLDATAGDLRLQRHLSYADRIRCYWRRPEAQAAVGRLKGALTGRRLPEPLLRQGFPTAVLDRAEGLRGELPMVDALLQASVQEVLAPYYPENSP